MDEDSVQAQVRAVPGSSSGARASTSTRLPYVRTRLRCLGSAMVTVVLEEDTE